MMKNFKIDYLLSGGLITNYHCTSECAHCLYACSPRREKSYISPEQTRKLVERIKSLGCQSVHIGGGEPFLNTDGLTKVLQTARRLSIGIDYVETNASWFKNHANAVKLLKSLKKAGLKTALISISPFHNEFIPFYKTKGAIIACREAGVSVFPWIQDFFADLNVFDEQNKHKLNEYKKKFGDAYLKEIPSRYWIHFGGRAIETFKKEFPPVKTESLLKKSLPCTELADTSHFHFDLYRNYIPGLCTGFSIKADDIGKHLHPDEYPFLNLLYYKGIKAFYEFAYQKYNFAANDGYLSKCHLCMHIRQHIVLHKKIESKELQPLEFYNHISI